MASKIPEEDFELAYIRRQRATKAAIFDAQQAKLAAEEEFDRREYEHLLKRKQAASSAVQCFSAFPIDMHILTPQGRTAAVVATTSSIGESRSITNQTCRGSSSQVRD